MDPNACLQLWREAESTLERREHGGQLRAWLMRGGFEPKWDPWERGLLMRGYVRVVRSDGSYWYWGSKIKP